MKSSRDVFTTGEVAKICRVSQQTIIRCIDNGSLKGFRVPGSKFRKIPRNELLRFMRENGLEIPRGLRSGRAVVMPMSICELPEILSTGVAAKLCGVSQQTIIRALDDGELKGFRVPGSRFRRVSRGVLVSYMRRVGIPVPVQLENRFRVLVITKDDEVRSKLVKPFAKKNRFHLQFVSGLIECGLELRNLAPHVIVFDGIDEVVARTELLSCRAVESCSRIKGFWLGPSLCDTSIRDMIQAGFDKCFERSDGGIKDLIAAIRALEKDSLTVSAYLSPI